jgi:vitamin B12 transporter
VWDGREPYGEYTVVDVAGRVFLDKDHSNTINIRVENIFDKEYASLLGSAQRDADGSDYTYWNLGLPRTLSIRYSHQF